MPSGDFSTKMTLDKCVPTATETVGTGGEAGGKMWS